MRLNRVGSEFDRVRVNLNRNADIIESEFEGVSDRIEKSIDNISELAFSKVVDSAKLNRKEPVNTYSDLEIVYPNAKEGWAVMVKDSGRVYRFYSEDDRWGLVEEIDATAINEVDSRLSSQIGKKDGLPEWLQIDIRRVTKEHDDRLRDLGLNVKMPPYNAKGVGNDTVSFQKVIDDNPAYSTIFLPSGRFSIDDLKVPKNKIGITFIGSSKESTRITFSSKKAFSLLSGYITFKDVEIRGNGTDGSILFSDDREEGTADFDISFYNCLFTNSQNLVRVLGRGVKMGECIFKEWLQGGYIIEADFPSNFVAGSQWTQSEVTGFRSFQLYYNRFHFVTSTMFRNRGRNAKNLTGVHIVGNYIEGPMKIFEGYARDLLYKGNTLYQVPTNSSHGSLFEFDGGDNIDLDIAFSLSNRETDVGYSSIILSNTTTNNLTARGTVFGVKDKVVVLRGGGSVIDIDFNIRRQQSGTSSHYVHLYGNGSSGTVFRSVRVSGRMESPNGSYVGVEATGVSVNDYSLDLLISGTYGSYSKGLNALECRHQHSVTRTYIGDGTSSRKINLKFMPRTVQVIGVEGNGESPTYNNLTVANYSQASLIVIEDGGFAVSGAANKLGNKYIYIVT